MNVFAKILKFIGSLFVRAGLDKFLKEHMALAIDAITDAAWTNSSKPFHEYKGQVFDLVKKQTGQVRDTWVSILIDLAYETLKSRGR